jgi:uncharacterized membrane protein
MSGKGDQRRPPQITRHEESLRWAFALGEITKEQYEQRYRELEAKGLIQRSGRVLHARDE